MIAPQAKNVSVLLTQLQTHTQKFLDHVVSQGLPEPSFESGDGLDPMKPLPKEVEAAREAAVEATVELQQLLLGPLGLLLDAPGDQYLLLVLQYVYRNKIQHHVPLDGETTFEAISTACGLPESDVARFLRYAIARHVFQEPRKGVVAHTAASKLTVHNKLVESWLLNIAEEFWPSLSRTVDATAKWPGSEEPNESGYSLAHNTSENPFDVIKRSSIRQQQFIDAMSFSHLHPSYNMSHLVDNYDFGALGKVTIVDVGGSHGQVAIAIAKRFPEVTCIVQDLPDTICGLQDHIPGDLKGRILGMQHDFLTPQTVRGADVFLLRWILHDWSDKYCIEILRNLIPGLKKGSKIIINDVVIPEPNQLGPRANRYFRCQDLAMKAFNNARERDVETWEWLFETADARFSFKGITMPPEARMAIIEAEWTE